MQCREFLHINLRRMCPGECTHFVCCAAQLLCKSGCIALHLALPLRFLPVLDICLRKLQAYICKCNPTTIIMHTKTRPRIGCFLSAYVIKNENFSPWRESIFMQIGHLIIIMLIANNGQFSVSEESMHGFLNWFIAGKWNKFNFLVAIFVLRNKFQK